MPTVKNMPQFLGRLRAEKAKAKDRFANIVWNACELLHHEAMDLTPVWSGSAVVNYHWSVGVTSVDTYEFVDNGPPGPTNTMPLGVEPRREPNEAVSLQSLYALNVESNPYRTFWLNNADPDIIGLDYGLLPDGPDQIQRSRQGISRLAMAYVALRLGMGHL